MPLKSLPMKVSCVYRSCCCFGLRAECATKCCTCDTKTPFLCLHSAMQMWCKPFILAFKINVRSVWYKLKTILLFCVSFFLSPAASIVKHPVCLLTHQRIKWGSTNRLTVYFAGRWILKVNFFFLVHFNLQFSEGSPGIVLRVRIKGISTKDIKSCYKQSSNVWQFVSAILCRSTGHLCDVCSGGFSDLLRLAIVLWNSSLDTYWMTHKWLILSLQYSC